MEEFGEIWENPQIFKQFMPNCAQKQPHHWVMVEIG
jgi:hypothetical protein